MTQPVPAKYIPEAGIAKGEIYRLALTNRSLGCYWWCFGPKPAGVIRWYAHDGKERREEEYEEMMGGGGAGEEGGVERRLEEMSVGEISRGEEPGMLAMVIEKGDVDFMVV